MSSSLTDGLMLTVPEAIAGARVIATAVGAVPEVGLRVGATMTIQ